MSAVGSANDVRRGERDLLVVAYDYGRQQSAATSRYRALAASAATAGVAIRFLTEAGLRDPEAALLPIGGAPENKRSLPARALSEVLRGIRMGFEVPREGIAVVAMPAYFTGMVVATILRFRRRPYRLDVRDIYPDVLFTSGVLAKGSLFARVLDAWTDWVLRGADGITAATAGIARHLEARVKGVRPVLIVRNGFGGRFQGSAVPPAFAPLIATHGTMGRFQNNRLLADVILEVRRQRLGWKFVVIGDGPTAHDLDPANGPDLTRISTVGQNELPGLLAPAWVGLSLRTDDNISADSIPVRMLEYLGLGIPVLVHPRSEGGEEIERAGCGTVVGPADAAAVVEQLKAMVAPEAHARFRAQVLAQRAKYSAEAQWESFLAGL